jgi:hypothetical protein
MVYMKGIFYNSKKAACSIWESGKMCYDALSKSTLFTLDYSEDTFLNMNYDFAIFNQHFDVNNWITETMIKSFIKGTLFSALPMGELTPTGAFRTEGPTAAKGTDGARLKPAFCIVTEVTFSDNPISLSPNYFTNYIILDPTVSETSKLHAFGRPIEKEPEMENPSRENTNIPNIFSFGFPTQGKEWHKIVEIVQNEFDYANIHFNIPKGSHISQTMHDDMISYIYFMCESIITKKGINLKITHDNLTKEELIKLCAKQTINCFYYDRQHIFSRGLAAVTDQAISSGRPLLVTGDTTFRHIHKYINYYPNISLKEAIEQTQDGVLKMRRDWSSENFLSKFENILRQMISTAL